MYLLIKLYNINIMLNLLKDLPWIPTLLVNRLTGVSRQVCDSVRLVNLSDIRLTAALIMQAQPHFLCPLWLSILSFLWECRELSLH